MRRTVLASIAIIVGVGAGIAASNPIAERQALMKANGKATTAAFAIVKGAAPFKLETVQAALKQYIESAEKGPTLFPPGSGKGRTEALPAIWKNKSDFDARFAKLGADSKAALVSIKDAATFKSNYLAVVKNCDGCHELYRAKDE